jgi:YD repeat-containing protein
MPRRFRTYASLFLALALSAAHFSAQSGPATYIYDELGRLVGVIDSAGEAAIYAYDAVGNLLSITRKTATQVSIIEFTPNSGGVGATVTIQGTGFSTTPASNTVQFNGTTATVTAASANKLVTTVPTDATTGPISVTTPNGSATSTQSFTVAAALVPTITSFTPAIGVAGVQVTINGTNFDLLLANNRVKLGVGRAGLVSATPTVITATVPSFTGSGKISVTTPVGQGVGAADFYVPPSPYTAADVVFTDRLTFAQSKAVPINTATKIGLAIFDATQGQRVSVKVVPGPIGAINLHKPDGSLLVSRTVGIYTILVEASSLATTWTYTVNVDPSGNSTGTTTLTAYDVPADVTGTITPGGASQAASLNTPGQNAQYTFSGTAGQRVSLKVDPNAPTGTVSIKKPDGSTLASTPSGVSTGFIDATSLPTTGTYTVFADPSEANTGNVTVTIYDVPADITGTITPGGAPVTVTITTPGQNANLTFSGTTGQRVSLKVNANVYVQRCRTAVDGDDSTEPHDDARLRLRRSRDDHRSPEPGDDALCGRSGACDRGDGSRRPDSPIRIQRAEPGDEGHRSARG